MMDAPSFVTIAALVGDQARATMLNSLLGGEARTPSELAAEANITRQTASSHLSKLVNAGLLVVHSQGRHRYFALATSDVANMLESIFVVAEATRTVRALPGPRDPALRKARRCYDHLAGELAVEAYDSFCRRGFLRLTEQLGSKQTLTLTDDGADFFESLNFHINSLDKTRRPICRPCLDWSVRRHHLAGRLGKALLEFCIQQRWARSDKNSRIVHFSSTGELRFRRLFIERQIDP